MTVEVNNYQDLTALLVNGKKLMVKGKTIKKATLGHRIICMISAGTRSKHIAQVQAIALDALASATNEKKAEAYTFTATYIKSHSKGRVVQKTVIAFDRALGVCIDEHQYLSRSNQSYFAKWSKYGLDPVIFRKFPTFANFLEKTKIASQMKIGKDQQIQDDLCLVDGVPHLKVNGDLLSWPSLEGRFVIKKHRQYPGLLLYCNKPDVDKGIKTGVYHYLPNGNGLQLYHPFKSHQKMTPICRLSDDEIDKVRALSQKYTQRDDPQKEEKVVEAIKNGDDFIMQIVSSTVKGPNTNLHTLVQNRKHPWMRVICTKDNVNYGTKKGDVFEVGYNAASKWPFLPLTTFKGHFRSPDSWNYQPSVDRVVTNFAVTREEVQAMHSFVMKYHLASEELGEDIGFHFGSQNCSAFVGAAFKHIGIDVPTKIKLLDLIAEVTPDRLKTVGRLLGKVKKGSVKCFTTVTSFVPGGIKTGFSFVAAKVNCLARKIIGGLIAVGLVPARFALGGALGRGGQQFEVGEGQKNQVEPPLKKASNWFDLNSYYYHLPGRLQAWMREQPSTVIYQNPIKLTVVPPEC